MKKGLLCVLLLSTFFSCIKHEDAYVEGDDSAKKKEEYDKGFPVKDIDPKQDWNLAEQFIVNVSVNYGRDGEYTIKIYSDNPRNADVKAYLLGKYAVKDGSTNALLIDGLSSLENVYVCCVDAAEGSMMKKCEIENGKVSVTFGGVPGRRSVSERGDVVSSGRGEMKRLNPKDIYELVKPNEGIFREGHTPSDLSVLNSYEFKSTGKFTIYPVFGLTKGNDEVGFYYYDPKEGLSSRKEVSLTKIESKKGNLLDLNFYEEALDNEMAWVSWEFAQVGYGVSDLKAAKGLRSRAFYINVPKGNMVGFWVKNQSYELYSNSKLNQNNKEYSAVIYNENNNPEYIGLEDWPTGDNDCNDIIFYIAPDEDTAPDVVDPEKPLEKESMSWIIACEDLGSVGDYDFNDVVFSVSHVSGESTAVVTPLAAGGTLPAKILYGGKEIGEIHELLGGSNTSTMINTSRWGKAGNPITITVGADFTMSSGDMGGFSLKIGDGTATITAPGKGKAPQMICVPGDWQWPTERTSIVVAYKGFGEWGANYGTSQDWWQKPTGNVIKRNN
ncbi:MAG: DUF4842 domain-containing protein [Bacteroides sp.]|nr:DUF4842 domain-containing protein [Bacteroides sp.]